MKSDSTQSPRPDLSVQIGPLRLKNPVTVASGTFGYGTEYLPFYDPARLGGIFLKGLTLETRPGNLPQRLAETPSGLMNAIGLQNVGVEEFIATKLPALQGLGTACIANICGSTVEDYIALARRLAAEARIDALELNVSCPNVKAGCLAFGSDPVMTEDVTRRVVEAAEGRPVIVKLSPNVASIATMARATEAGGAAAVSLVNTFLALAIDVRTRRPRLGNVTGGLSGPAIRPIAVRMVWEAAHAVSIPVIGQGGIMTADDALEFIIAGAAAVSIGTANFVNPKAPIEVLEGIEAYLRRNNLPDLVALRGSLILDED
ncbi:MAG: dihydroorotate dehydrogenase [bacterium]|nr:dihydroorotate dehydrogenase [bacterium]